MRVSSAMLMAMPQAIFAQGHSANNVFALPRRGLNSGLSPSTPKVDTKPERAAARDMGF